ncbi:hypothetical protein GIB67_000330 [Kingdonia uniflora]|uniref:Uncharacterized protein n=1 Tax=Kingdonia uniflora TaxID=39325 RepID=A0A7J7LCK2_9MAGN|nr:hypothetical protein GIB67_000330 [Kingdonia uniflora]
MFEQRASSDDQVGSFELFLSVGFRLEMSVGFPSIYKNTHFIFKMISLTKPTLTLSLSQPTLSLSKPTQKPSPPLLISAPYRVSAIILYCSQGWWLVLLILGVERGLRSGLGHSLRKS